MKKIIAITIFLLASCTGIPEGITPVDNFDLDRYLGDWYEIARLDNAFEKGLINIKANYSSQADGSVKVVNTGFSTEDNQWEEAIGKASFVKEKSIGHLKVSFFGPFYGSYIIFKLDQNYQYAYVTSHNRDFLWLLSRTSTVSSSVTKDFIDTAKELGFHTNEVIFVQQNALN